MSEKIVVRDNTIAIKDKEVALSDIKKQLKEHLPHLNTNEIKVICNQLKNKGVVWNYKTFLSLDLILD